MNLVATSVVATKYMVATKLSFSLCYGKFGSHPGSHLLIIMTPNLPDSIKSLLRHYESSEDYPTGFLVVPIVERQEKTPQKNHPLTTSTTRSQTIENSVTQPIFEDIGTIHGTPIQELTNTQEEEHLQTCTRKRTR